MRRLALALAALGLSALPGAPAGAFNPSARPAPPGVDPVCADDPSVACQADTGATVCASGTCVGDPADLFAATAVRGTLTLVTDEDVTGWDEGADTSEARGTNARLTLLLQYERGGALRSFAETYVLSGEESLGDPVTADVYDDLLSLTFATASPPHQLIAFGFAKAAEWKPRQIAAELSDVPLRALESRLEHTYLEQSELDDGRVVPAFAPLRTRCPGGIV